MQNYNEILYYVNEVRQEKLGKFKKSNIIKGGTQEKLGKIAEKN